MRSRISKLILSLMLVGMLVPMMGSDGCDDDCGYGYYDCTGGGGYGFDFGFSDWGYSDGYYDEVYYEEGFYDGGYYDDGFYDDGYYDDGYYDDYWKKKNPTRS